MQRDWGYAREYVKAMWKCCNKKSRRIMLSQLVKLTA